jgi:2-polyprenyl-3-methyl-5-hydroxy-6-metoxy-1,4-benzoquinol methylase
MWFADTIKKQGYTFDSAIDIGCNNGYGFSVYGLPFVSGPIILVDFASKCLDEAKKLFKGNPNIKYHNIDITKDWISPFRFDLVCLCQVIQHIPDIVIAEKVFKKACSLCGVRMIFSHYGTQKHAPVTGRFDNGLFYRRCSVKRLTKMIEDNKMEIVHHKDIGGDLNFILSPRGNK